MHKALLFFFLTSSYLLQAQVQGGEHVFEFLRLAQSPHITALGSMVVSSPAKDMMLGAANPALLRPEFHTHLGINYNMYYANTKVSNVMYAYHAKKLQTTFGIGLQYLDYGNFSLTDAAGYLTGESKATDYCIQLIASRSYLEKWRYGATLKFANSNLIDKKASALLADIGVMYADTNSQWYIGATIKNAGITIKNYETGNNQPLPMDLQIGITKKFKKAPFSLSALAHHLHTWDIRYDNPADASDNQLLFADTTTETKTYFADKLFRHFVFAVAINLGKRIEISAGYNHMRRAELAITEKKGMSGFSYGAGLYLNKFALHFSQSHYHIAGAYTEMGLSIQLNQLIGSGSKLSWAERYANQYH